jgi:probable HAF family extracellular repeat protein
VHTVTGTVTAIRNGVSVALNAGDVLLKDDVIQTANGSTVSVAFGDGTTINLSANSQLGIANYLHDPSTFSIALPAGIFEGQDISPAPNRLEPLSRGETDQQTIPSPSHTTPEKGDNLGPQQSSNGGAGSSTPPGYLSNQGLHLFDQDSAVKQVPVNPPTVASPNIAPQHGSDAEQSAATDTAGNTASETFTIKVQDTTISTPTYKYYAPLDDPSGRPNNNGYTVATGINDAAQIVGWYIDKNNPYATHGFLYSGGMYTSLDDPLAGSSNIGVQGTVASAVNNRGQIVGYYGDRADGRVHGFVFTGGTYDVLDDPLATNTYALAINDRKLSR